MQIAYYLLASLLVATLAGPFLPESLVQHGAFIISALLLVCSVAAMPATEFAAATSSLRRCAAAMLLPIAWMLMQLAPIPFALLGNQIWSSTALALNEPSLFGRISVNAGSTVNALIWYLAILCLTLSTALLTNDRRRAEITLFVLTTVATFWTLGDLLDFASIAPGLRPLGGHFMVGSIAAIGNAAIMTMIIGRQARRADKSRASLLSGIALALLGIMTASASLAVRGNNHALALIGLALAILAFVAIARRMELAAWVSAAFITVLVPVIGWVALSSMRMSFPFEVINAASSNAPSSIALAQRALVGSTWLGEESERSTNWLAFI
ncbi:hypothetical protein ACTGJ9_036420 [Bradyrhizobium sp. RDM12]